MKGFLGASIRSFSGRILGALSALVASYSITSTLTIDESGLFFLSLGFAIFFSHALRFGLDSFALKKCAIFLSDENPRQYLSLVVACILVSLVGSLSFYGLGFVLEWSGVYEYARYIVLAFPAAMALAVVGIIANSLHAMGFVFTGTATNVALNYLLFTVCVWWFQPESAIEAFAYYFGSCVAALTLQLLVTVFLYRSREVEVAAFRGSWLSAVDYREMYLTAIPIWLIVISQQLNMWGAQFISAVYIDEAELALLAIAMRIAMMVPMILTSVNMVVSPKFASYYHNGEMDKVEDVLRRSLKLLSIVSLAIFGFIMIFGAALLSLFGEQYADARLMLSILVCGQLVNAMTGPSGRLLMMSGFERDIRNSTLVVTVLGLLLAVVLSRSFGAYGAAIATALTVATQNIALAYLVNSRVKINVLNIYASMLRPGAGNR